MLRRGEYRDADVTREGRVHEATASWWPPAPVQTCCGCISLRGGVGILAALDVLQPLWVSLMVDVSRALTEEAEKLCSQEPVVSPQCEDLHNKAQQLQSLQSLPVLMLSVVTCAIPGVVGLVATYCRRPTAAYIYFCINMLRCAWCIVVGVWMTGKEVPNAFMVAFFIVLLRLHYTLVVWSYYRSLKTQRNDHRRGDEGVAMNSRHEVV